MAFLNKREDVPQVVLVSKNGVTHLEIMTDGEIQKMNNKVVSVTVNAIKLDS